MTTNPHSLHSLWLIMKHSGVSFLTVTPRHNAIEEDLAHISYMHFTKGISNGCLMGRIHVPVHPYVLSLKLSTVFSDIWYWEYELTVVRYISFWSILVQHKFYYSWSSERIEYLIFLFKKGVIIQMLGGLHDT
jgi:hypothetical protein